MVPGQSVQVVGGGPPGKKTSRAMIYPWKKNITATIFWVGEAPSGRNKTPNNKSSWDTKWQENFGGYDNPDPKHRRGFIPNAFVPQQNPFYVALPYNDVLTYKSHRPEARRVIPWFKRMNPRPGRTVLKGRWVAIYANGRYCFAQWEDCGPWAVDDWEYVFGNKRPKNKENKGAGIDVSPAVRDFLGIKSGDKVHWKFVEFSRVPKGPWAKWGKNNPFVNKKVNREHEAEVRYMEQLRRQRDRAFRERPLGTF